MDDLRLILLLVGAGVILGVYAWTRLQSGAGKRIKDRVRARTAPSINSFSEEPDDSAVQEELQRMQRAMHGPEETEAAVAAADSAPAGVADSAPDQGMDEQLIVVSVVAGQEKPFAGDALGKAFANNELRFGDKGIYHRMVHHSGVYQPVFGVANMVKPGDFGDGDLRGFQTPGVTLFLQLPGPQNALEAFDDFVHTAERLAVELGGQLMDRKHCVVTHQALMAMRDGLVRSNLKSQIAS
jgi:cell division protein ZipA